MQKAVAHSVSLGYLWLNLLFSDVAFLKSLLFSRTEGLPISPLPACSNGTVRVVKQQEKSLIGRYSDLSS